ncbi:HigA family addiction module antitoxin [Desulfovibrio sp.]|uniref:HigA family addiction module antitoxin n=1 Tax=Desulfovibrio sp. TaxID=885 RepID=UPI0025C0D4A8|nr:HigA family addiction module antitoxin [Desulfovibrio sp.]
MCANKYAYDPDYAVAPGETVREVMESFGMTQREFAMRLDTTAQNLNRIFKGTQGITAEMANKLERVTGTSASFWNNLEGQYRSQLAKEKEAENFQSQREWLKNFPLNELEKRGYIEKGLSFPKKFEAILSFFGVSSVQAWENTWQRPAVAARRSVCFERAPHLAATWIRMGENEAQKRTSKPTDIKKFKNTLEQIRPLTREEPTIFCDKLDKLCADCGIILVLVREFKNLAWSGATKWNGNSAVIMLNLRGKQEDKFWFSFFHEAGHVILHGKNDILINDGSLEDERENEANEFAYSVLFKGKRDDIPKLRSTEEIRAFAQGLNISPGIVAGQYQFMTKRYTYYHKLIRHFKWNAES